MLRLLWLVTFLAASASAFINPYPKGLPVRSVGGDVGNRLILTPYIEAGKIEEAKKLALVMPLAGSVKSYSGYVTVDKKCDSNMFIWFFPADGGMKKAPVTLWLQGGPGATSLYGLFTENGPYDLTPSNDITLRNYSWTQFTSMLFIDNPVGTGYSYAKSRDCYSKNEEEVGRNLLEAVKQVLKLFPEVSSNPFFITGESYAGKYIPALAHAISNDKSNTVKLEGMAIGNGFVDPINQLVYDTYLYNLGLLDDAARDYFHVQLNKTKELIKREKWEEAVQLLDVLLMSDFSENKSFFTNVTGFENYFNFLNWQEPPEGNITEFITRDKIRKSIHVGNATWDDGEAVHKALIRDELQSVRPWLEKLLEKYRVLIYNGQLDIVVAYPTTVEYLKKLNWSAKEEYKKASRKIWRVDKDVAGYYKSAGKLTEVMVRNAGHMVPMDQPKWSFDLISRFIYNKPFK